MKRRKTHNHTMKWKLLILLFPYVKNGNFNDPFNGHFLFKKYFLTLFVTCYDVVAAIALVLLLLLVVVVVVIVCLFLLERCVQKKSLFPVV